MYIVNTTMNIYRASLEILPQTKLQSQIQLSRYYAQHTIHTTMPTGRTHMMITHALRLRRQRTTVRQAVLIGITTALLLWVEL